MREMMENTSLPKPENTNNAAIADATREESESWVEVNLGESATHSKSEDAVVAEIKKLALSTDTPSVPSSSQNLLSDGNPEQTLDSISEAGKFSLAAICALSLHELFCSEWDEEFSTRSIRYITLNLQLPKKVEAFMLELIRGNVSDSSQPYLKLIRDEAFFQKKESFNTVLLNFITLAVQDGKYDSRWRVLIQHLARLFDIEQKKVEDFERQLISCVLQKTREPTQNEKQQAASRKLSAKTKRFALIGLATIGGGALIGVTGGLAAPLIGVGLTSFLGSSAILTAIGTTAGATVIGSLFGVAGGGLTGYKMHKRVGDIQEFEFHELNPVVSSEALVESVNKSINTLKELHVTIVISGWIKSTSEENFTKPWLNLLNGREQYYLKYESSYLLELGKAMEYILSCVASFATQEVLKFTLLSGLITAVSWPASLLGFASVIDNPWGVCLRRSAQVGKQLAEVLLSRSQGHRPVTLLGYSLGARVIYYCLREMSDRDNCEGIIQDVILLGAPCTAQASEWNKFRRVVAGRIINGYSRGDWLLRFLYRTLSVAIDGVAGLQEIELNDKKMHNVDLTSLVTGHGDYPERMTDILSHIGIPINRTEDE